MTRIEGQLRQRLAEVDSLSPQDIPPILASMEELRAILWRRMLVPPTTPLATAQLPTPTLMTVAEVASALRFSRGHVYELIRCGSLAAVRTGRALRVATEALLAWQARHDTAPVDSAYSVSLQSACDRRSGQAYPSGTRT